MNADTTIFESVVDYTRDSLDPAVFYKHNEQYYLLPSIRTLLLQITAEYQVYGHVKEAYLEGSILSYQWNKHTDIDLHIVLRGSIIDAANHATKKSDSIYIPNTAHCVNVYVLSSSSEDHRLADGVYDLLNDRMLRGPYNISAVVSQYLKDFNTLVSEMDLRTGSLKRNLIDYKRLQELSPQEVKSLQGVLRTLLHSIDEEVTRLGQMYSIVHQLRSTGYATSQDASHALLPTNVIYKLLERYHYTQLLRELYRIRKHPHDLDADIDDLYQLLHVEMTTTANVASYPRPFRTVKPRIRKRRRIQ